MRSGKLRYWTSDHLLSLVSQQEMGMRKRRRASRPPADQDKAGNLVCSWLMADPAVTRPTITQRKPLTAEDHEQPRPRDGVIRRKASTQNLSPLCGAHNFLGGR